MNRSWIRAFYTALVLMVALMSSVVALYSVQPFERLSEIARRLRAGRCRKVGSGGKGRYSFNRAFGLGLALLVSACNPAGDTVIGGNFYPGVTLSLSNSTVSIVNPQVLSGNSISITVSLKDADGNPFVSTLPVVSLQTGGGTSTGVFSSVVNNGDGTYSSIFSAVSAGTPTTITSFVDGSALTSSLPLLTVVSGNFSLAQSLITLSSGSVVSGSQVTITLTVKDSSGNFSTSGGLNVVFSNSGGTSTGFFSAVTDNQNGTYTTSFTGGVGGTATAISASIQGSSLTSSLPNLTVIDLPPGGLLYSTNPASYTKGSAIASNTPFSAGGPVEGYTINPALPAGLTFNGGTGAITGTPTNITTAANYTVTASNTGGSVSAVVSIAVNDVSPSLLTYSSGSAIYTKGSPITNNTPSNSGGSVLSYAISPALPTGLNFSVITGIISGTPSVVSAATNYTITATNSGGSVTDLVSITVNDVTPSALSYSSNPATYIRGTAITNNTPTLSGGAVVSYSVSPSLPGGLSFNTSTGVISGTPTIYTSTASYVVSATNSGGSTSVSVSILVKDVPLLSYAGATGTSGTVGSAMTVNPTTFSAQGAAITGCAIKASTPALPVWATLNTTTCVISGTPTGALASTSYTIDAINSAGTSADATVSLSVVYPVPTLTSITPNSGTRNGGTSVAVAGTGFYSGVSVTLGGNACTSLVVNSTTQITCTTPAHTIGAADVVVTNPGVTAATLTGGFTFTAAAFTQNWDFNTASQYTYNNTKISFTGGVAELTSSSQTDNSSNCTTGFGDGVTPSCGGTSTGTIFSSATDGLGSSNYMVLSHAGTATDLELDSSWTPAWGNLLAYWRLDENSSASLAADSSSSAAYTATPHGGVTFGASGKLNNAMTLSSGYLKTSFSLPTSSYTESLWVYMTALPSNSTGYVVASNTPGSCGSWCYAVRLANGNFSVAHNGSVAATSSTVLSLSQWHHLAVSYNSAVASGTLLLFLDGIQVVSVTSVSAPGSDTMEIGNILGGTYYFNGTIDDVAVWNTALSASAIATIYQHESAAHAGTLTSRVMDGLSSNSWTTLAATTTLPFGKELPDTANASPSPTPTSESQIGYSSQSANLLSGGSGVTGQLVGLWHLDETAGTTGTGSVLDRSGQGNNGTPAAGVTFGVTGEIGAAAQFSGSNANGYITAASTNLPIGASSRTYSMWVKPSSLPSSGYSCMMGIGPNSAHDCQFLCLHGTSGNKLAYGGCSDDLEVSYTVSTTSWTHMVATFDGTTATLYANGMSLGSTTKSSWNTSSSTITFGNTNYKGYPFTGAIDESSIWSRALSPAEVLELYRRGANRIRYQVRTCADSTCSTSPTWLGPDGTNQTYFSELNNNSVPSAGADLTTSDSVQASAPTMTFANFGSPLITNLTSNRYFQYRAIMESDDTSTSCNYGGSYTSTWCSPELQSVTVGPTHYDTSSPSIVGTAGFSYATLSSLVETLGTGGCSSGTFYNLSPDGSNWYYLSGSTWTLAGGTASTATSAANLASNLSTFATQLGAGTVYFKIFLQSSGTSACVIDNLAVGGTQ